ncbi:putative reverse transcriptase domain-containing protein [Tanacetum coccineum]
MENVIDNSGCAENQKVKFAASSFVNKALTWWNTQGQTRGREAAIGMSWTDFKALLVEEFCPSNEMEKLESEFWNHKIVGANHAGYIDEFHELAKLVPHLSAILRARILTDKAVSCGTLTKGNEKRKGVEETKKQGGWGNDNKRAKVSKGFMAVTPHRNGYAGPHPKCAKFGTLQDPNIVTDIFSLDNHYATVLFNSRADFSFISTDVAPLLIVKPSFVNPGYVIELTDGKKVEIDRIIHDCKLELGNSLFTIDLIPLGHGSFNEIVGMDWLSKDKAEITCHEKVVRIPLENGEILHVQRERILGIAKALSNAKSKEEHEVHLRLVLELLKKEKLYAKFSKCKFWLQEVQFLSHVVYQNGIHVDLSKFKVVKNWKAPTTPFEIQSFLGLAAMAMTIQSRVRGMILAAQGEAFKQENVLAERLHSLDQQMEMREDGSLYFIDRIWVLLVGGVRTIIMDEAHKTRYSVHPGADKMYHDLRDMYWWPGMKRDIATYVSKFT